MRNVVITQTGVGYSQPIPLDQAQNPENTALAAILTGAATYNLEYSVDDPFDNTRFPITGYPANYNTNANWFGLTGLTNLTTSSNGNTALPARAIRVNITAGTGGVQLTLSQSGLRGG